MSKDALEKAHAKYCDSIGNVSCHGAGRNPANQQRRFHQSTLKCDFKGSTCSGSSDGSCAVCSIIETGFQMKYAGANAGTRFGAGIYSSSTPSKAYDYGNKKGMFVVNVACGVAHVDQSNDPIPSGTHCRVANASSDENIVFDDAAMVPRYLIIFG